MSFWRSPTPISNELALTDEQLKIVNCNSRLILASACPGSGKSTTLAARANRLWNVYQEPILVCTFSNKAVEDIAQKIGVDPVKQIKVCTIHKLGLDLVRQHWALIKKLWGNVHWPIEPKIAQKEEELFLLDKWVTHHKIQGRDPLTFFARIEELRKYDLDPNTLRSLWRQGVYLGNYSEQELGMWESYESYRLSYGMLLFSDMINLARNLMTHPEVSQQFRRKYTHFLLDEAQDTSTTQWDLLRPLIGECHTVLVVYDTNQAIYGWRGGDITPLTTLGFVHDAVRYSLTKSFRSGQNIAEAANMIVPDKSSQIQTERVGGEVKLYQFETRQQEAEYVLSVCTPNSAILARTNSYLEFFERQLIMNERPYTGSSFYRSRHIASFIADMREWESGNLERYIQSAYVDNLKYTPQERADFLEAWKLIKEWGLEAVSHWWTRSQHLPDEGIVLSTGHASKGLEWDEVYVVGVEEGQIPHSISNDLVEEQNLFYVMCTRARNKLHLSWSGRMSRFLPQDWKPYIQMPHATVPGL